MKNLVFQAKVELAASRQEVMDWHERPSAFERLSPPWADVTCVERTGSIRDNSRVVLLIKQGAVKIPWVLGHKDFVEGHQFCDYQIAGPFEFWQQTHRVEDVPDSKESCLLVDTVEFRPPLGAAGWISGATYVKAELARLFRYRHEVMRREVALRKRYFKRPLRILITGATGLVGRHLVAMLQTQGHEVLVLSRQTAVAGVKNVAWDPLKGEIENIEVLENLDAIVHLSGRNVTAARWTLAEKQLIYESRIKSTSYLASLVQSLKNPPAAVVVASAMGYYGGRGSEPLTEDSSGGSGFLAEVCRDWEAAAMPMEKTGTRLSLARIGAVLTPEGGALQKLLPVFSLGAGGPVGNGKQYFSWISIDDMCASIYHAICEESIRGPFNAVSPDCLTNSQFSRALGRVLKRPTILPVKESILRAIYGEAADALVLNSLRVLPQKLKQTGYQFFDPDLDGALRFMLGR